MLLAELYLINIPMVYWANCSWTPTKYQALCQAAIKQQTRRTPHKVYSEPYLIVTYSFFNSYKDRDTNYSGFPHIPQDMARAMVAK